MSKSNVVKADKANRALRNILALCLSFIVLAGMTATASAADAGKALPYSTMWLSRNEQLLVVREGDAYGVIRPDGTVVVPLGTYTYIKTYSGGMAAVAQGGFLDDETRELREAKWGYIDTNGKLVIPIQYEMAKPFSDGYAVAFGTDTTTALILDKNGSIKGKVPNASCAYYEDVIFSEGLCVLPMADFTAPSFIAVDSSGKTVVSFPQKNVDFRTGFRNGLVVVGEGETFVGLGGAAHVVRSFRSDRYGYADRTGKTVIPAQYDDVDEFSYGMAAVKKLDSWGFIDVSGKQLTEIVYPNFRSAQDGIAQVFTETGRFYLDNEGNKIANTEFDVVWDFASGYGVTEKNDSLVVIDKAGKIVLTSSYKPASKYIEGYINVEDASGKIGAIDIKGTLVVPFMFDDAYAPVNGYMIGGINGTDYTVPVKSAVTIAATPNASAVRVNGKDIAFDAYTINGNNYFKLRDLAHVLNGTGKQFEVKWDGAKNAILLTSNTPYTAVGGEMQGKGTGSTGAVSSSSKILVDGKDVALTAYTIGGNNYFKLRDIAQVFNFGVTWDGAANTIRIDTATGYTAEAPRAPSFPGGAIDSILGMTIEEVVAIWGPHKYKEDLFLPEIQYGFEEGLVKVNVTSGQVYDVLLDGGQNSIQGLHIGMTEAEVNTVVSKSQNIKSLEVIELGGNIVVWNCVVKDTNGYLSSVRIPYEEYYSKEKKLEMGIFFEDGILEFMSYTIRFIDE